MRVRRVRVACEAYVGVGDGLLQFDQSLYVLHLARSLVHHVHDLHEVLVHLLERLSVGVVVGRVFDHSLRRVLYVRCADRWGGGELEEEKWAYVQ